MRRWMPFSMGQRDCVGQNLARMNYLSTVAMLLARFSLRLAEVPLLPALPLLTAAASPAVVRVQ